MSDDKYCQHAWKRCDVAAKRDDHGTAYGLKKCVKCGKTEMRKLDTFARG